MVVSLPAGAPSPRLCVIEKRAGETEYGYNLHAERAKGQFVGLVDNGSPAYRGGLKQGDRIFAVNGHSIIGENHKKVVERIKQNPNRCEMLVISEDGAKWYAEHGIPITLELPNIIRYAEDHTSNPQFVAPPPPPVESLSPTMHEKPMPRLCRLVKPSSDDEFGFNLHAERGRGHFIGTVDAGGIGDRAGLRMGQRIVGVNDTLVYPNTPHKEVVQLIKRSPLSTTLLVASEDVDKWYKEHNTEYSFSYAEEWGREGTGVTNGVPHQPLAPHSIHISDDDDEVVISPLPPQAASSQHSKQHAEHLPHYSSSYTSVPNGSTSRESGQQPLSSNDSASGVRDHLHPSGFLHKIDTDGDRKYVSSGGNITSGLDRTLVDGSPLPIDTSTPLHKMNMPFPRTHQQYQRQDRHHAHNHFSSSPSFIRHQPTHFSPPPQILSESYLDETPVYGQQGSAKDNKPYGNPPVYFMNYVPSQVSPESLHQQASPVSGNSVTVSGYTRSSGTPTDDDIYSLSANDAREFLRSKNRKNRHRGIDMSLDEKYQLITNM